MSKCLHMSRDPNMSMHREKHMLKSWILAHHKLGVLAGAGMTIAIAHLAILDKKLSTCPTQLTMKK